MFFLISIFIVFTDCYLKYLVHKNLKVNDEINLISGLFKVVYVENKGAAFGILKNNTYFLVFIALIVISVISIWSCIEIKRSELFSVSTALIIGGSIGNLIDRLFLGYVIDYLKISFFPPVCNISDYCIFMGTVLICFYFIKKEKVYGI